MQALFRYPLISKELLKDQMKKDTRQFTHTMKDQLQLPLLVFISQSMFLKHFNQKILKPIL